jgi:uncharacterized membrane protein
MKASFEKIFLLILAAGTVLVALLILGTGGMPEPIPSLRIFLGVVFVLFVPGYVLQEALFVHRTDMEPLVRVAASLGLSIAVTPLIFLALSFLGFGVSMWPYIVAVILFILACALVAFIRRRRLPRSHQTGTALRLDFRGWWAEQDRTFRILYFLFGLFVAAAAVSGVLVSREVPDDKFTEFYLLDSQGSSEEYPREAQAGEPVEFLLGIANREGVASQYTIVAVLEGDQPLGKTGPVTVEDGTIWEGSMTVSIPEAGKGQKVEFLLERTGSPWPYRTLRVWMNVNSPETTRTEQSLTFPITPPREFRRTIIG